MYDYLNSKVLPPPPCSLLAPPTSSSTFPHIPHWPFFFFFPSLPLLWSRFVLILEPLEFLFLYLKHFAHRLSCGLPLVIQVLGTNIISSVRPPLSIHLKLPFIPAHQPLFFIALNTIRNCVCVCVYICSLICSTFPIK